MRYRKLRIAWSVVWGLVAVLLVVLWVRSFSNTDIAYGPLPSNRSFEFSSCWGVLQASLSFAATGTPPFRLRSESLREIDKEAAEEMTRAVAPHGFRHVVLKGGSYVIVPHGFAMALAAVIGGIPWALPMRFSLRALLITTTLVAVVLGLIVWAAN